MTIEEFYAWAKKNNCTGYKLTIQHGDDGGYYSGSRDADEREFDIQHEAKVVKI